jgi:hypothetical protein
MPVPIESMRERVPADTDETDDEEWKEASFVLVFMRETILRKSGREVTTIRFHITTLP